MFGLLGIGLGAGLLGFGAAQRGQRHERDRQLRAIDEQNKALDKQLTAEERAYRDALRSNRNRFGSGEFASRLFSARRFTGF